MRRGHSVSGATPPARMTIGRLARAAEVNVETIRYYQRIGLLQQPPTHGRYRYYDELHLKQLRYIRNAKQLKLSLGDIAMLQDKLGLGRAFCAAVREVVRGRVAALDREIAELTADRAALGAFLVRCENRSPDNPCPVQADLVIGPQ